MAQPLQTASSAADEQLTSTTFAREIRLQQRRERERKKRASETEEQRRRRKNGWYLTIILASSECNESLVHLEHTFSSMLDITVQICP